MPYREAPPAFFLCDSFASFPPQSVPAAFVFIFFHTLSILASRLCGLSVLTKPIIRNSEFVRTAYAPADRYGFQAPALSGPGIYDSVSVHTRPGADVFHSWSYCLFMIMFPASFFKDFPYPFPLQDPDLLLSFLQFF
jgi:hypothetical protein